MASWAEVRVEGRPGLHRLAPGMVLGRGQVGLPLDDPSVSEAHALCTHREEGLVLIALRGTLTVDGQDVDRVALTEGLELTLAPGVDLFVRAVHEPAVTLVLEAGGRRVRPPPGYGALTPALTWDGSPADDTVLESWTQGAARFVRIGAGAPLELAAGMSLHTVLGVFAVREVPAGGNRREATVRAHVLAIDASVSPVTVAVQAGPDLVHPLPEGQALLVFTLAVLQRRSGREVTASDLKRGLWAREAGRDVERDKLDKRLAALERRLRRSFDELHLPPLVVTETRGWRRLSDRYRLVWTMSPPT